MFSSDFALSNRSIDNMVVQKSSYFHETGKCRSSIWLQDTKTWSCPIRIWLIINQLRPVRRESAFPLYYIHEGEFCHGQTKMLNNVWLHEGDCIGDNRVDWSCRLLLTVMFISCLICIRKKLLWLLFFLVSRLIYLMGTSVNSRVGRYCHPVFSLTSDGPICMYVCMYVCEKYLVFILYMRT